MKTIDLDEMNLVELNHEECERENGGWLGAALAIIGAAIYIYNNAGDFVDGFSAGQAAYQAQK